MTARTHNYEVLEITNLVVSPNGGDGAVIAMHCAGGPRVQLVLAPQPLAQLEGLLDRANLEQLEHQQLRSQTERRPAASPSCVASGATLKGPRTSGTVAEPLKFLRDPSFRRRKEHRMGPSKPITNGRELALRMNAAFPGRDWIAMLMDCSGCPRDYVEWHLQEELVPPEAILTAAGILLAEAELARDGGGL